MRPLQKRHPYSSLPASKETERALIRPEGKFQRERFKLRSKFGPSDCTSINPSSQLPVLPDMIYIRPA